MWWGYHRFIHWEHHRRLLEKTMTDAELASIARNLANALMDFAYTRKDEDKKRVNALQSELCARVKEEETT